MIELIDMLAARSGKHGSHREVLSEVEVNNQQSHGPICVITDSARPLLYIARDLVG